MASQITEQDQLLLINSLLPVEARLFRQKVVFTCVDVVDNLLAVGSEQGIVWVVDMQGRRVVREISENRMPITTVQLNPCHALVSMGTADGLLVVMNYYKPLMKQLVKEKDNYAVSTARWSNGGDSLYIGYVSGKLLHCKMEEMRNKLSLKPVPLLECGSEVVQISIQEPLMLISTVARPLLLDIVTGKLTQVGSRERKAGSYGGCVNVAADTGMVIARPGLRLWMTDMEGKVLSTAKFKDVLANSALPPMTLYGGIATPTAFNDASQFGLVLPWVNNLVVCYYGNTIWVLEPSTLSCLGVMSLGQKVVGGVTYGRDLYLLLMGHQRPLVKLSLPRPPTPTDNLPSHQVTPESANNENGDGRLTPPEDTVKEDITDMAISSNTVEIVEETVNVGERTAEEVTSMPTENPTESGEEASTRDKRPVDASTPAIVVTGDTDTDDLKTDGAPRPNTPPALNNTQQQQQTEHVVTEQASPQLSSIDDDSTTPTTGSWSPAHQPPPPPLANDDKDHDTLSPPVDDHVPEDTGNTEKAKLGMSSKLFTSTKLQVADLKGKLSQPLGKLKLGEGLREGLRDGIREGIRDMTHIRKKPAEEEVEELPMLLPEPLKNEEVERRNRMIQDGNSDNVVVVGKTKKPKKRKPKRKRLTPTSSTHSSIERLTDIMENDLSPCDTPTLTNELCLENQPITPQSPSPNEQYKSIKEEVVTAESPEPLKIEKEDEPSEDTGAMVAPDDDPLSITTLVNEENVDENHQPSLTPAVTEELLTKSQETINEDRDTREDNNFFCTMDSRLRKESRSPTPSRGRSDAFLMDPVESLFAPSSDSMWREIEESMSPERQLSRSLPIASASSSNSIENSTHQPSDSDSDSEDPANKHNSIASPDYYSLVDDLIETRQEPSRYLSTRNRSDALVQYQSHVTENTVIDTHSADIWVSIPQPSHQGITSLCLSATSLWITDSRNTVYWTHPSSGGRDWQALKKHMSFTSSSYDGLVVWGVYQQQAYARYGISDINPAGTSWKKITGKRIVAQNIKWVSCDQSSVWAITTDNKILFRNGVSESRPEGRAWVEVESSHSFFQVVSCKNIVWALDASGRAYVRTGMCPEKRYGVDWQHVKSPTCFGAISIVSSGVIWGMGSKNRVWFKCGASAHQPEGGGHWWEVAVGSISSKPVSSSWRVLTVERSNSILHTMTSFISSSIQQSFMGLSACLQSGVCLLSEDNQLHACWKVTTGYYNEKVTSSDKMFSMSEWVEIGLSDFVPWLIQDDGELFCITSKDKIERVACPGQVTVLSCSPSAVWVVSNDHIWSRQGMCTELPQGISWDYIELGTPMQELKIVNLAIGKTVVWAIDHMGCVHFRFGVHPREPGTGMAPAWIPVDDESDTAHHFKKISVSPDNAVIWVLDRENQCYVRRGVTEDFPVGRSWEHIAGELITEIVSACGRVFGITMSKDLVCRQGITEGNPGGNYWRRLPGKFRNIATTPGGELWLIDERGNVTKQQSKVVSVCQETGLTDKAELEKSITVMEWEVI